MGVAKKCCRVERNDRIEVVGQEGKKYSRRIQEVEKAKLMEYPLESF